MKTHGFQPFLEAHPFFHGMSEAHIDLLAGCARNVRFEPGEFLIHQGREAEVFFVIREGRVSIEIPAQVGGAIVVRTLKEGDVLGWSWLFPPYRWHFDARSTAPVSALALDGKCLRGKCDNNHEFGYEVMKRFAGMVVGRLEATTIQLLDLYAPHAAR